MALNNVNIYGFKLCEYLWLQITREITLRWPEVLCLFFHWTKESNDAWNSVDLLKLGELCPLHVEARDYNDLDSQAYDMDSFSSFPVRTDFC